MGLSLMISWMVTALQVCVFEACYISTISEAQALQKHSCREDGICEVSESVCISQVNGRKQSVQFKAFVSLGSHMFN